MRILTMMRKLKPQDKFNSDPIDKLIEDAEIENLMEAEDENTENQKHEADKRE